MRQQVIFPIVRGATAMFVGYGVIVLLTSLGFNGVLGGRPLYGGSPLILGAGNVGGGYRRPRRRLHSGFDRTRSRLVQCVLGPGAADWRYNFRLVLFQAKHCSVLVRCCSRGDSHDLYRRRWILEGTMANAASRSLGD